MDGAFSGLQLMINSAMIIVLHRSRLFSGTYSKHSKMDVTMTKSTIQYNYSRYCRKDFDPSNILNSIGFILLRI